jgi:hypothetical protein
MGPPLHLSPRCRGCTFYSCTQHHITHTAAAIKPRILFFLVQAVAVHTMHTLCTALQFGQWAMDNTHTTRGRGSLQGGLRELGHLVLYQRLAEEEGKLAGGV